MQMCTVSVRLKGSLNHVVSNKRVSIPEIKVLQAIHGGADAVQDIRPAEFNRDFNHEEERQRLRNRYERGNGNADDEGRGLVARLFGAFGRLPTTLKDIGYDARTLADAARARAEEMMRAAEEIEQSAAFEEVDELNEDEREALRIRAEREIDEPETVPAIVPAGDIDNEGDVGAKVAGLF